MKLHKYYKTIHKTVDKLVKNVDKYIRKYPFIHILALLNLNFFYKYRKKEQKIKGKERTIIHIKRAYNIF